MVLLESSVFLVQLISKNQNKHIILYNCTISEIIKSVYLHIITSHHPDKHIQTAK